MKKIEIYTKNYCPFCKKAVSLLEKKEVQFTEYDVTNNQEKLNEAIKISGITTVPQFFVDGVFIGGHDDIMKLESEGKLDNIIKI